MDNSLPGNSHRAENTGAPQENDQPTHKPVVQGRVIQRKKPLGRRLKETFFAESAGSVVGFVVASVIVPKVKDLLREAIDSAVDHAFNGTRTNRPGNSYSTAVSQTRVSYNSFSRPTAATTQAASPGARRAADPRDAMDIGEIILEHKHVAEAILESLWGDTQQYGRATVAALYQLLGRTPVFTDHKFGWKNLDDAEFKRIPQGYLLVLPPVESL